MKNHAKIDSKFIGIGILVAFVIVFVFVYFATLAFQVVKARTQLSQRHLEATKAIQYTYGYFRDKRQWPENSAVQKLLPADWEYYNDGQLEGPILFLHGPYHMTLSYRFERPIDSRIHQVWELSMEGDRSEIQATVNYSNAGSP